MNQTLVDRIVRTVLYEGYLLYPYRPSVKNRRRWTFGTVCPPAYSRAQGGTEASEMRTECLVHGTSVTTVRVTVRFLGLTAREADDWQEATERTVGPEACRLGELLEQPRERRFSFPARPGLECGDASPLSYVSPFGRSQADVGHPHTNHNKAGMNPRTPNLATGHNGEAIAGCVELSAEPIDNDLFRLRVRILNHTELAEAERLSRDEAMLRSLVSTHTILEVRDGAFVSLTDPPEPCRAAAAGCRNEGTWPILVGAEGDTDAMLSSPIILPDYPQVAAESPGDLFDATEIDEILTLRILTLTDEEKAAMAALDERGRALLQRTEALAREQLLGLHGTVRGLRPVSDGGRS
jgi:hydrogenase maturation protease